jgi:AhpD family alkylhydroperoxidase
MTEISSIDWADECILEARPDSPVLKDYRKAGPTPPGIEFFAASPWLGPVFLTVNLNDQLLVHTDFDFVDLLWLAVSQDNSCRYCYAARRSVLQILGHSEERIRSLEEELFTAELNARDRVALDFARRVSRASPAITNSDKQELIDAGFDSKAVDELAFVVAFIVFANRISTIPALPLKPVEELPSIWYVRLFRPVLARVLRALRKRGQPEVLAAELRGGNFGYLVEALDGLPVAKSLRRLIDGAFASSVMRDRTRALIFAVVAKAIGCPYSEAEARRILAEEGLEGETVDAILRHLGSPELDAVESLVVPFARETVHVQAPDIQRKARKLADELGNDLFLDVLGCCALANMICRLEVVVEVKP